MRPAFVLDHGLTRPQRLLAAFAAMGIEARVAAAPKELRNARVLIVPDGDDDDTSLSRGMPQSALDALSRHIEAERPVLCIGLALHLLLNAKTHAAMPPGLGVLSVGHSRFDPRMTDDNERPILVPHVGFSYVVGLDRHPLLSKVIPRQEPGVWLSFKHRLCAPVRVPQAEVAVCHHGIPFAAAIWRGPLLAVQFLPELSGRLGLEMLRAFVRGNS